MALLGVVPPEPFPILSVWQRRHLRILNRVHSSFQFWNRLIQFWSTIQPFCEKKDKKIKMCTPTQGGKDSLGMVFLLKIPLNIYPCQYLSAHSLYCAVKSICQVFLEQCQTHPAREHEKFIHEGHITPPTSQ